MTIWFWVRFLQSVIFLLKFDILDSYAQEPPRPPTPEPTITTFVRDTVNIHHVDDWTEIKIRLVGTHPLWGHYLSEPFIRPEGEYILSLITDGTQRARLPHT